MLTKSQIKKILTDYNIRLKKSLGQNFLIDKNIKDKIIEKVDIKKDDYILEIGPGLGALTEDLALRCKKVVAIEKDRIISGILKRNLSAYKNLEIIEGDILDFDLTDIPSDNIKVIGNLPYYITTPIIFHLLEFKKKLDSIFITVQKEVAQRMVAKPASKNYGVLTLSIQFHTKPTIEMMIKKGSFFPVPEVDSSLIKLRVLSVPPVSVKNEPLMFKIIRLSFNQRRKMLLKALSHRGQLNINRKDIQSALESLNIDPKKRGETLSLSEFANLANAVNLKV